MREAAKLRGEKADKNLLAKHVFVCLNMCARLRTCIYLCDLICVLEFLWVCVRARGEGRAEKRRECCNKSIRMRVFPRIFIHTLEYVGQKMWKFVCEPFERRN